MVDTLPNDTLWAETYYVYDVYGNLSVVFPPEATRRLSVDFFGQSIADRKIFLNDWAFLYDYDGRNRMIMKKVPGADSVLMVYDKWDRLVLTQDGNQRDPLTEVGAQWMFTKYDALNRPVVTGLVMDRAGLKEEVEAATRANRSEEFQGSGLVAETQYSDLSLPQDVDVAEYHTITYYDNYLFRDQFRLSAAYPEFDPVFTAADEGPFHILPAKQESVKGLVTGTKTKILGNSDDADGYLETITYYDKKYRVIQVVSENHLGGIEVISTQYDFVGNVKRVHSSHQVGAKTIYQLLEYEYDHADRLLSCDHSLDGAPAVRLYTNEYNELGELIRKRLHVDPADESYKQSIDYAYNIRGWLTSINEAGLTGSQTIVEPPQAADLFNMELIYNTTFTAN